MKKFISLFFVMSLTFSLTACSGTENQESSFSKSSENSTEVSIQETLDSGSSQVENFSTESPEISEEQDSRILIAYFSWADNAILEDNVDAVSSPSVISPGNVQQLAGWIQEATGGDLFSIRVTDPYPSDWDACLARANQERTDNDRPELVENVADPEQYDTIFLGYPKMEYLNKSVYSA